MKLAPRYYQTEAVQAVFKYLNDYQGNPCVVLPTGAGKTIVISQICKDVTTWGGRVCVLAHVKELLEQAADKLQHFMDEPDAVGVYSAGLNRRDTDNKIICGGIQSVYKRAGELGPFAVILIDEAHLISPNEGTMYRQFIEMAMVVNPKVRIIGLTATPYRLDHGYVCGLDNMLNEVCYEIGIKELIAQGFLCPIRTRAGKTHADLSGVHTRGGEYIESEMAERMDAIVLEACKEIVSFTSDRKSILVFCSSVKHAQHVQEALREMTGQHVGLITGDTPAGNRAFTLQEFKAGSLRWLVNMNVLTTGFDAPNVDAIALMRATLSPGLYYQMVGRGLRTCDEKQDTIILDYGENAVRHGPVDNIQVKDKSEKGEGEAPAKECPQCQEVVHAGVARCPACAFEFPPPEVKHGYIASGAGVLSGEVEDTEYTVTGASYRVHESKKKAGSLTMRVDYDIGDMQRPKSEWVCIEHEGYAGQKAAQWWRDRSKVPVPETVEEAVELARLGALAPTEKITWRDISGQKFGSIIRYFLGDIPDPESVGLEPVTVDYGPGFDDDDIPF